MGSQEDNGAVTLLRWFSLAIDCLEAANGSPIFPGASSQPVASVCGGTGDSWDGQPFRLQISITLIFASHLIQVSYNKKTQRGRRASSNLVPTPCSRWKIRMAATLLQFK